MIVIRLEKVALVVALLLMATTLHAQEPKKNQAPNNPEQISYYKKVRPIFQQNCQGCHQPAKASGGFIMTTHADLLKKGDSGKSGIVPGHPEQSFLVEQVTAHDKKKPAMPPKGDPLIGADVKLITQWIAEGAKDDTPATAKVLVDPDHPPVYNLPPVITSLAYSPDSKLLAVSGYHETLLHKANGSGLVARLVGAAERISSLAFSPDGKWLAVGGGSPGRFGEIQIWDVARKRLKLSVPTTFDTVYGVSWSPDGTQIAFGCADNSVRAIDAKSGEQIFFNGGHNDWVLDTVFSKDSKHLVSVSRDMSMKLHVVKTQRLVDNITSITPGALKGGLITVDRHPAMDELLIGGADGEPKIYQMIRTKARQIGDDYNLIRKFAAMPGRIYSAKFNANGSRIIAGSSSNGVGEVRIYLNSNGKTGLGHVISQNLGAQALTPIGGPFAGLTQMIVGAKAAVLSDFGLDNNLVCKVAGKLGPIFTVAFRPDGKQVASAGFDGVVRLSDPNTGTLIREFIPCPVETASTQKSGPAKR